MHTTIIFKTVSPKIKANRQEHKKKIKKSIKILFIMLNLS